MGGRVGKENRFSLTFSNFGTFHCAMIGLDSAGKTTVLYRMKLNQYVNSTPTIGFNCEKIRMNGISYLVWDAGGQEKLRPLWRSYTRCTDAIIFVVDSSKEDRLEEAKLELFKITKCQGALHIPILILANKQDLPEALNVRTIESQLGVKQLGSGASWHVQATCGITGDGLEEGMEKLHELILQRRRQGKSLGLTRATSKHELNPSKASRKVQRSNSHHF